MKSRSIFSSPLEIIKKLNLNQWLFIFGGALFLAIAVPLIFFIVNFKNQQLSIDIKNWGDFGAFVGGVIGVILAIANLIVLIVITIQVNKLNSVENKKLFLYRKRIEAYDELSKFFPTFKYFPSEYDLVYDYYLERKNNTKPADLELEFDEKLNSLRKTFNESYYFIISYNKRYGHLFDYDFKSEEFMTLIDNFHNIHKLSKNLISCNKVKYIEYDKMKSNFITMNNLLDSFVSKILKELE